MWMGGVGREVLHSRLSRKAGGWHEGLCRRASRHSLAARLVLLHDQILSCRGIEQLQPGGGAQGRGRGLGPTSSRVWHAQRPVAHHANGRCCQACVWQAVKGKALTLMLGAASTLESRVEVMRAACCRQSGRSGAGRQVRAMTLAVPGLA